MATADTDGVPVGGSGGDASVLMQSIDWAATALGPATGWSSTLRTMVGLLLRNRFPLSLWWGPELIQLYNDAYRPILGNKHPRAMAQPARDCFREAWETVGPMIESPFRGGPPTTSDDLCLLLERKGFLEETHFKVAFSPIPDKTAGAIGVGGVLGTCAETTEQVYGQRQQRTLRELATIAAGARTAEEACTRAAAILAENTWDVPFALLYLLDETGDTARLASTVGFGSSQSSAAPALLQRADARAAWPLGSILCGRTQLVEDIAARFGPLPSGRWSVSPTNAVALALEAPGQRQPYGIFVSGVSPHRALDARYRGFFELAAARIGAAIRSACAHQRVGRRATAVASIERTDTAFSSYVTNELRTPLTSLLGPLEDAWARPDRALTGEGLAVAYRSAHRLLKQVNTLLDFSRLESAGVTLELEESRAEAFVREAACWASDAALPSPPTLEASARSLEPGAQPLEADVRILVADDNAEMREYVTRTLRQRWTVLDVADGEAALKVAREWQPDLVLVDEFMPGLSGFGLLSELHKDARTRACSVILLSGRAGESRIDGLEAGASDYLIKPFSTRELVARVSAQVQLTRLRKVAEAERARLFAFLMQLPVAIAACEGPSHVVTLMNPLAEGLTQGRLQLGDALTEIGSGYSLERLIEMLDRVYASGEHAVWREQTLSIERDHGGSDERLYDIALQPLRDAHGAVTGIVAAAYEVAAPVSTRRKNARRRELALLAREQSEELGASLQAQKVVADAPRDRPLPPPVTIAPCAVQPEDGDPIRFVAAEGVDVAQQNMPAQPPIAMGPALGEQSAGRRILVVDDDHDAAALLEEALTELGFSVAVAYDGPSALQLAGSFHPDTALVDVGLPSMDGLELGRRLRDAEATPGLLRLVAVTGYGRESDRLRSLQAGFELHLVKPLALEVLLGAVSGERPPRFPISDGSGPMINDHGR